MVVRSMPVATTKMAVAMGIDQTVLPRITKVVTLDTATHLALCDMDPHP